MQVERRSDLSIEDFTAEYLQPRRPVILTDATAEWTAHREWSFESLRDRWKSKTIHHRGQDWQMAELVDRILSATADNPVHYLKNVHLQKQFPELVQDVQPRLAYAEPNWFRSPSMPSSLRQEDPILELFVGGPGTHIRLHYDEYYIHNFITQICGRKEFWFFPPEDGAFLYPDEKGYLSQIMDPKETDLEQFPLYPKATPMRLVLEPGETLLVPAGWWHKSWQHEPSISVGSHCVNATNWRSFVEDYTARKNRPRTLRRWALRARLWSAGLFVRDRTPPRAA